MVVGWRIRIEVFPFENLKKSHEKKKKKAEKGNYMTKKETQPETRSYLPGTAAGWDRP